MRAYLESYRLVDFTGEMTAAYPGFLRATPKNGPSGAAGAPIELGSIRPMPPTEPTATGGPPSHPDIYGYAPYFVASLAPVGDGFRAFVCEGDYSVFRADRADPNKFRSIVTRDGSAEPPRGDLYGINIGRIELTNMDSRVPTDHPAAPSAPQIGPAPAPNVDVFGAWFVTAASFTLWGEIGGAQDIATPELEQKCADNMPDDASARKAMYTGAHDQPPPHGDPIPGWPAEAK
ncbi:hypothetical protein BH10ACT3_BH10ACT3_13360 [soil metagenome]